MILVKAICKRCVDLHRRWNMFDIDRESHWSWTSDDDRRWEERGIVFCRSTNVSPEKSDAMPIDRVPSHCLFSAEQTVSQDK